MDPAPFLQTIRHYLCVRVVEGWCTHVVALETVLAVYSSIVSLAGIHADGNRDLSAAPGNVLAT